MKRLPLCSLLLSACLASQNAYSSLTEEFIQLGIEKTKTSYQSQMRGYKQPRGSLLTEPIPPAPRAQNCSLAHTMSETHQCLSRNATIQEALQEQARYLKRAPKQQFLNSSVQLSKQELEQTIKRLQSWNRGNPQSLAEMFFLQEINADPQGRGAMYTGYITPTLNVKRTPDRRFRFPIYTKPKNNRLPSHADIKRGALAGKGLEIAWTDNPIDLYFAQIQGAAHAIFPDGSLATLTYAGNNGHPYRQIANYLKAKGYKTSGFGNESIKAWLYANPDKIAEVLTSNPRFVFFNLKQGRPKTSIGAPVIPWHTVAVDDKHIPLGSILLAELPVLDANGREQGTQWQLLFAQDRGGNIQGHARIDLYLGAGHNGEIMAQGVTGYRRTFLLRPKNS
ncbi:MAG: MltA domain-containing protein [Thiofilum sp.]|uniref:MltA domain-containing protein n=1 Tax=Thiofilum sp. TaxID=2212733 RepID=UPI0025FC8E6D|nr:MltA domain-containing protein [Thiofilum sp.]MBK8453093.1 MltA domain-containing protein [Thiofilum sp.]